jgi:hypothetical protein
VAHCGRWFNSTHLLWECCAGCPAHRTTTRTVSVGHLAETGHLQLVESQGAGGGRPSTAPWLYLRRGHPIGAGARLENVVASRGPCGFNSHPLRLEVSMSKASSGKGKTRKKKGR